MTTIRSRVIAVGGAVTLECGACLVTYYVAPFSTVQMLVNAQTKHNEENHAGATAPPTEGGG